MSCDKKDNRWVHDVRCIMGNQGKMAGNSKAYMEVRKLTDFSKNYIFAILLITHDATYVVNSSILIISGHFFNYHKIFYLLVW